MRGRHSNLIASRLRVMVGNRGANGERAMTRPTVPDESRILEAEQRIRPYLGETPLLHVPDLDAALGHSLGLKFENLHRTGSIKVRGALNWL